MLNNNEEEIEYETSDFHQEVFEEVFTNIQTGEFNYLQKYDPEWGLFVVYEALIYFLLHEEYSKCALLRNRLNEFLKTRPNIPFVVKSRF